MYNKKTAMWNKFVKFMDNCNKEAMEERQLPFRTIAQNNSLTAQEKVKAIYNLQQESNCKLFFVYGKQRYIKGGDRVFYIDECKKSGDDEIFDSLKGVYYNITKNETGEF